ncbi:hypothetical protein ACFVH6_05460 [Spirillospora sp. NPDC127200]
MIALRTVRPQRLGTALEIVEMDSPHLRFVFPDLDTATTAVLGPVDAPH